MLLSAEKKKRERKEFREKPAVSAKVQYIKLLQLHARGQSVKSLGEKKLTESFVRNGSQMHLIIISVIVPL